MTILKISDKILLVIALMSILTLMSIQAQDTLSVSLPQALEIALTENPTIKVATMEIQRVDYSKKEKFAALYPNISAVGSYQRSIKKQKVFFNIPGMPPNPDGFEMGQDNTVNTGFSASLPIISPTLWASLKMTETDLQLTLESARSSKVSLINQVSKAYYAILLTQDQYSVVKRSFQNTSENARIIYSKFQQGTVSEFEWIRADVQVKNASANLVSTQSAVNMSILQLKMLLGLDMYTGLKVQGSLSDFEKNIYSDVLSIDTTSLSANTDLIQFDLKAKQLDHALKMQKANWWPTLAASFNYMYMSMGNDGTPLNWFPTSSVALQLNIPIFQGGARVYKQKQLQIQKSELSLQRDNLRRGLEFQTITSLDNIKKSLEKISSNRDGLRQAEKAVSIAKKLYEVGSATYLELSNAEVAYIQAGLMYNQSIFDYLSAKADLEKLLGNNSK
jgi:outer membrane protein